MSKRSVPNLVGLNAAENEEFINGALDPSVLVLHPC